MILRTRNIHLPPSLLSFPFSTFNPLRQQRADSDHCPTTQSELSTWNSGVNDFVPPDNKPFGEDLKEKDKRSKPEQPRGSPRPRQTLRNTGL